MHFWANFGVKGTALSCDAGGPPIGLLKFAPAKAAMHPWVLRWHKHLACGCNLSTAPFFPAGSVG